MKYSSPSGARPVALGAPPSKPILAPWQRPVVVLLLAGVVVLAGTGLFLLRSGGSSGAAAIALVLHLVAGVVTLPALLLFAVPHAVAHLRRRPVIGLTGVLVLATGLFVSYTGALLALERSALRPAWTWPVHVVAGFGIVLLYALHRRFGTNPASWTRLAGGALGILALGGALLGWEGADPSPTSSFERAADAAPALTRREFLPSNVQSGAGGFVEDSSAIDDTASCAACHARITDEWRRSAHRHASMTNPFYKGTIQEMRRRYPLTDTKWCASCHDPALLFTGQMDRHDLDLEGPDARVGLTCISCHAIQPESTLGNGDYVQRSRKVYAWEKDPTLREAHDVLLKMKPDDHVRSQRPHNIDQAEFCSLCHKAEIPPELNRWKWNRAQDEYDFWHDSGVSMQNARSFYHPAAAKRCQDCHMPLQPDPNDPAADAKGMVRSHLFSAANTALPYLRGDLEMIERQRLFLQQALRVDVTGLVLPSEAPDAPRRSFIPAWRKTPAVKPGELVEAHVVVRNFGVGHRFPGGTIDSNEAWVEFQAQVGDEPPFYVSGAIDPETGRVDRDAEYYRAYWMDRHGKRVDNRIGPDMYTLLYVNVIGPGTADVVRYRFRVPEGSAGGELRLRARVRYRKFMGEYLDMLFGDRGKRIEHRLDDGTVVPIDFNERKTITLPSGVAVEVVGLPIIDMSTHEIRVPVTEKGTVGPAPAPHEVAVPYQDDPATHDRERVNDLAIGYLLQDEPVPAAALFDEVTKIDRNYVDGWVNVGRALIDAADFEGALRALRAALAIKPGFAKAHFFTGEVYKRQTKFAAAEAEYRAVLLTFPGDRMSIRRLAEVLYEQGKYEESLAFAKRMLAIDPADAPAWFWALQGYKEIGTPEEVAAADAAFDRFRPDDDMDSRQGKFLIADPSLQRMQHPIHVHLQEGLVESER